MSRRKTKFRDLMRKALGFKGRSVENSASPPDETPDRSALEDLGALTASIEHEIKTPLSVINIEVQRMIERYQFDLVLISHLERIKEETKRIYAVTKIVPLLRGTSQYYQQFMERTDLDDSIRRSIKAVRQELHAENIFFQTYGTKSFAVRGNNSMLEQVFVNILKNAVEAIRESERKQGRVVVHRSSRAGSIMVEITDNGCGIPKENIDQLTGIMFTTKQDKKANSGIGLFIANRIVSLHNGRVEIQSDLGVGTTVSVILPRFHVNSCETS